MKRIVPCLHAIAAAGGATNPLIEMHGGPAGIAKTGRTTMTSAYQGSDELLARTANFVDDHRDLYLSSGGAVTHLTTPSFTSCSEVFLTIDCTT